MAWSKSCCVLQESTGEARAHRHRRALARPGAEVLPRHPRPARRRPRDPCRREGARGPAAARRDAPGAARSHGGGFRHRRVHLEARRGHSPHRVASRATRPPPEDTRGRRRAHPAGEKPVRRGRPPLRFSAPVELRRGAGGAGRNGPGGERSEMKFGDLEIFVLSDGRFRLDGGAMFGVVPKMLWQKRIPADDRNRITLGLNCLLVRSAGKTIVVETGTGDKGDAKWDDIYGIDHSVTLLDSLHRRGVEAKEGDIVINTDRKSVGEGKRGDVGGGRVV